MSDTNSLTGALFDKEISGFLASTNHLRLPYTNNGVTKDVLVTRPENQGKGHVRGFEAAWNGFFEFLPGVLKNFGARTSYTYVTSGGTRNSSVNPYDTNHGAQFAIGELPARGLEPPRLQHGAVLQRAGIRSAARLQLALALPFDHQRGEYQSAGVAGGLRPARRIGPVAVPQSAPLAGRAEVVNIGRTKLKELIDNQNGAGLTYHNIVDSDRRFGIYLRGNF